MANYFFLIGIGFEERLLATLLPSQSQQSIRLRVRFKVMIRSVVHDSLQVKTATLLGLVQIVGRLVSN